MMRSLVTPMLLALVALPALAASRSRLTPVPRTQMRAASTARPARVEPPTREERARPLWVNPSAKRDFLQRRNDRPPVHARKANPRSRIFRW